MVLIELMFKVLREGKSETNRCLSRQAPFLSTRFGSTQQGHVGIKYLTFSAPSAHSGQQGHPASHMGGARRA